MEQKTKSLLEELDRFIPQRNKHLVVESRASNIISSAINLLDLIEESFSSEESEELKRRLLSSIKNKNPEKFKRKIREFNPRRK